MLYSNVQYTILGYSIYRVILMSHVHELKPQLQPRINRIKGQIAALERALEQDKACIDILQQVAAIRGAVNGVMHHVLEEHIRHHLGGHTPDQITQVDEVLQVLKTYLK